MKAPAGFFYTGFFPWGGGGGGLINDLSNCMWSEESPETVSEVAKFKNFPGGGGGDVPRPPRLDVLMHAV